MKERVRKPLEGRYKLPQDIRQALKQMNHVALLRCHFKYTNFMKKYPTKASIWSGYLKALYFLLGRTNKWTVKLPELTRKYKQALSTVKQKLRTLYYGCCKRVKGRIVLELSDNGKLYYAKNSGVVVEFWRCYYQLELAYEALEKLVKYCYPNSTNERLEILKYDRHVNSWMEMLGLVPFMTLEVVRKTI